MEIKIAWYTLQGIITLAGGWVGWYLGGTDSLLLALVAFAVIDYTTGVFAAAATKQLSSKAGFTGIARKITIFLLVGLANLLDVYLIKEGSALRGATIFFYLSNEGISILENTTRIGLPVPPALAQALRMIGTRHNPTNPANTPQGSGSNTPGNYQPRHTNASNRVPPRQGRHAQAPDTHSDESSQDR